MLKLGQELLFAQNAMTLATPIKNALLNLKEECRTYLRLHHLVIMRAIVPEVTMLFNATLFVPWIVIIRNFCIENRYVM